MPPFSFSQRMSQILFKCKASFSSSVKPYANLMAENNLPFLEQIWVNMSKDLMKPAMLDGHCTLSNIVPFLENELLKAENNPGQGRKEGKTRALLFYKVASPKHGLVLVDAPGYGYARGDPKELEKWGKLMNIYITESQFLHRIFVLIDAEHGFKEVDHLLMEMLNKKKKPFVLVLTKCDKIPKGKIVEWYEKIEEIYKKFELFSPIVHSTSSNKNWGIQELRANIAYSLQMEILRKPI